MFTSSSLIVMALISVNRRGAATITVPPKMLRDVDMWVAPGDADLLVGDILNVTCTYNSDFSSVNSSCLFFVKRFPQNESCPLMPDYVKENPLCLSQPLPFPTNGTSSYKKCAINSSYTKIINSTTITLQYPLKVPELDESQFHCHVLEHNQIKKESLFVRMYNFSAAASNVSCIVNNFTDMSCHWSLNHIPLRNQDHNVTLSWGTNGHPNHPCPEQSATECKWPTAQFSMGSVYTILITVMTVDRWGNTLHTASTNATSFNTSEIVKISPVKNLRSESINSSCVQLTWQQDVTDDIKCRVQYDCLSSVKYCKTVTVITLGEVLICGLSPRTRYEWMVSCKPKTSHFWSDPGRSIERTPSHSSLAGPAVHPGSFTQLSCVEVNCRRVKVYWKNLPAHLSNIEFTRYQIIVTDMSTRHWDTLRFNFTNQTSHMVTLQQDRGYTIQINFCTDQGCQDFSQPITVPKQGEGVLSPREFTVELVSDMEPPHLHLAWKSVSSTLTVVSYTVFWCKGSFGDCKSPLSWYQVSANTSMYNLTLPNLSEDTFRQYTVGVSTEAVLQVKGRRVRRSTVGRGQVVSSGIAWSPCLYGKAKVPTYVLENVHQSGSMTSDSVEIAWDKLTCQQTVSVPTAVLLEYCVSHGAECTDKKLKSAAGMATKTSLIGLRSGEVYVVTAYAVTSAGRGPPSKPIRVQVKPDLMLLIAVLLSFGVLLLLMLMTFFIMWGVRIICTSKREEISVPGEDNLIEKEGIPPPPPINPPPDGRSSYKNGSYKQKKDENDVENVQLLRQNFYKEAPSQRSSAPIRIDNCYMVPPMTKSSSRHSKRHSESNYNSPVVTVLEAKSDDSFPLLDVTDDGIPRERISSFKGHLVAKDYGFTVKGQVDYEDLVNAELEKRKNASQESVTKRKKSPDKNKYKKHSDEKSQKKSHSVSFSDDEKAGQDIPNYQHYPVPSAPVAEQGSLGVVANKDRPLKKERRWSRGRPESDGQKYSDSSPRRISPDKRLSRDSDFPTPPPTPPLYVQTDHSLEERFSGQDFPAPPPPPQQTYQERQQTPEIRFSGHFSFPTPPPPPLEAEDELRQEDISKSEVHPSIPQIPERGIEEIDNDTLQRIPPSQNEMHQPYHSEGSTAPFSPKHRTAESRSETQQRFPPAPNEMHAQFRYPSKHGFTPAPKERKIELHIEPQQIFPPSPKEMQQEYKNFAHTQIPSPKQRTKLSPHPLDKPATNPVTTEVQPRSPLPSDRLSKSLCQTEPESTVDISFLLGDVLGHGMTVRKTEGNNNGVHMTPKPRQHIPVEHARKQPELDRPELVMIPQSENSLPDRESTGRYDPPKVAPKPVFIKTKDSVYGRLESSLAGHESQPPPT